MITTEWISAIAAIISLPISIWAIVSTKSNSKQIKKMKQSIGSISVDSNKVYGSGTMVQIGDKK